MATAYTTEHVTVLGTVIGRIWMPATVCTKGVRRRFDMPIDRFAPSYPRGDWPGSLRDALLFVTSDGDFQSCKLADATIKVTRYNPTTGTRRVRYWTVRGTVPKRINGEIPRGYIADCLTNEDLFDCDTDDNDE